MNTAFTKVALNFQISVIPTKYKLALQRRFVTGLLVALLALLLACSSATSTPVPTTSPTLTPTHPIETRSDLGVLDTATADSMAELEDILEKLGPRESATAQESAAANYLQEKLQGLGYATEIQEFPVIDHSLEGLGLTLITPKRREFVAVPMSQSGLGDVSGILTHVGLATLDEIPAAGFKGRIALAKRGVIRFQVKAENVFAAGAVGLVVYNSSSGIFQGSLAIESQFPVISISGEDGEAIEGLLAEAETQAAIALTVRERTSRNVIAEKPGAGEAVVVLGGHYDSVAGIAGANDNASGTAVLLAIARKLASVDLPFTLRIVPFGSEELGLLGSQYYVESLIDRDLEKIKVMLNFDALGSGSGTSVFGSSELTDLIKATQSEAGEKIAVTRGISGGTSDFASFQNSGVPFLMFYGDDLTRIHSDRDTIEFVQPELLESAVSAAVTLIQSLKFAEFVNLE